MTTAYATSPLKPRTRSTRAQMTDLDDAIVQAVRMESPVTVRGVYYRVVSVGAVEKTEAGYSRVQRRLLALRRSGQVDYLAITDGNRIRYKPASWSSVDAALHNVAASYRRALWDDQTAAVILMSEKDAITGVVYPVTAELDVELCITRGYSSETFTHSIARTVLANDGGGRHTFVYQLGDHDPSGVDAWRSFGERVRHFVDGAPVSFERIAVTPGQIDLLNLPTRPTKASDSRSNRWTGGESVEVDAIAPSVLRGIVRDAIEQHIDPAALALTRRVEDQEREGLRALAWEHLR